MAAQDYLEYISKANTNISDRTTNLNFEANWKFNRDHSYREKKFSIKSNVDDRLISVKRRIPRSMTYRWDEPTTRRDGIQVIECTCNVQRAAIPLAYHDESFSFKTQLLSVKMIRFERKQVERKRYIRSTRSKRNERNDSIRRLFVIRPSMHTSTLIKQHVFTSPRVLVTLHRHG